MAAFYRLGAALLLALTLGMIWTPAHASFPATSGTEYQAASGTWYPTLDLAGQNSVGPAFKRGCTGTAYYPSVYIRSQLPNLYFYHYAWCNDTYTFENENSATVATRAALSCPVGSTLSGSTCTCSAGYNQVGSTCVSQQSQDDDACKANADGLNYLGAPLVHFGSVGLTACFGGFSVTGSGAASGGGQTELYGPFKCTGAHAAACSVVPKPSNIVVDCPAGRYPGTVNGIQVCSPPENTVDTPKTTTATPPTPGASAPEIPNAPPGTASRSEQTVCNGVTCIKTITYRDGSGNPTGTKTEEESKANYCADNPKAPGCTEEKSAFTGNCSGGFVGTGDALQKATAEAANKTNCFLDHGTGTNPIKAQLEAGTFAEALPVKAKNIGQFDQSNPYGGSCPPDFSVSLSILGTHNIPLSSMCVYLQLLGYIALGVTLISSTIFVVKGFD